MFSQAKQIDLERRKMMTEVEVLRLKDQNNAETLQDLETMFKGSNESLEMQAIHKQLCILNERFTE